MTEQPLAETSSCIRAGRLGDRRDRGGGSGTGNRGGGRGAGVAGGALLSAGVAAPCMTRCTAAQAPGAEAAACRLVAATVMEQGLKCPSHHAEAACVDARKHLAWLRKGLPDSADTCAAGAAVGHVPVLQRQDSSSRHGARALHRPHVCDAGRGGAADLAGGQHTATSLGAHANIQLHCSSHSRAGCRAPAVLVEGSAWQ